MTAAVGLALLFVAQAASGAPAPFTEREVIVGTATGWPLPGTLTLPQGKGLFPAVVLVHGSGPADRDTTFGPNKPFRDIAHGLAAKGIAVLRYDKRTRVHRDRMATGGGFTVNEEAIDDVVQAVSLLHLTSEIDPLRIYVLGHSMGGMLIPRIAARIPDAAGFIVSAGAARPLEDALVEQNEYIANVDGVVTAIEQQMIDNMRKLREQVRALTEADRTSRERLGGAPKSYWMDLRGYDPPEAAKAITKPLFIMQGERDYQVTIQEFARWQAALAGRPNVTFKSYPALNHLFLPGLGEGKKSVPVEYGFPQKVDQKVIDDIAAFIKAGR